MGLIRVLGGKCMKDVRPFLKVLFFALALLQYWRYTETDGPGGRHGIPPSSKSWKPTGKWNVNHCRLQRVSWIAWREKHHKLSSRDNLIETDAHCRFDWHNQTVDASTERWEGKAQKWEPSGSVTSTPLHLFFRVRGIGLTVSIWFLRKCYPWHFNQI